MPRIGGGTGEVDVKRSDEPAAKRVFVLCLITALFEGADNVSLGLAAPKIAHELSLPPSQIGLALSASLIGLMLGSFLGGRLSDRIGRKQVLILSMLALGLFSLGTTVVRNFPALLTLRLLVGLGIGGAFPILIALASEASTPGRRATAIGLVYSGNPVGASLLSLLMGVMGPGVDWRVIFYVGGIGPLVLVPLLMLFLPESAAFREARRQLADRVAAPRVGVVLFGEGRVAATLLLWASCAFTLFVVYLLLNWLPSLMVAKGLTGPRASLVAMTLNLGGALGVLVFGAIVDRGGHRYTIVGCYLALFLSLAGLAGLSNYAAMLSFAGFAGFFMLGSQLVLYALASDLYPTLCRGTGLGAMVSVGRIGAVSAPFVAGLLLSAGYDATAVFGTAVACVFIAGALAFALLSYIGRATEAA